jgi:hypothetical protein
MAEANKNTSNAIRLKKSRQPMLTIVCGETGVGKTYRNRNEARLYLKDNSIAGNKGRMVLAFDTNDDDYTTYKTVSPDELHKLKAKRPRRIRPFNKDGSPMGKEEKKEVVKKILRYFKNGLILLDDIDDYMTGEKGQDMISALCTLRHKGVDIVFTHQSIGKVTRTAFQNCTWLRLHHQVDDVTYIKERIPKYPIVRIAQLIVDEQYDLAYSKFSNGQITEDEFDRRASYFVYVNLRKQRIRGCSRAAYIRACKIFIDQEEGRKIKMMQLERDFNENLIYKNRNAAVIKLITNYLRFHEATSVSPFQQGA